MRYVRQYLQLTKILCLNFSRDKVTLFFVIGLPLIFMVIFGYLYAGDMDGGQQNLLVVNFEDDVNENGLIRKTIGDNEGLEFSEVSSVEQGQEMIRSLEADMFLHVGSKQELNFYLNPARMQDNQQLEQQARAIAAEVDNERAGLEEIIVTRFEDISKTGGGELEFMFPGLVALGLASAGLFALVEVFMHYREKGVLKRMLATPIKKNVYLLSLMTSRLPGSLVSALLVLLGGSLLFGLSFPINWPLFIIYILLGTVIMMGLGALITLFAKTADSAVQAASILLTVMIFFSGIYFPLELLPDYLQRVAAFLPLTYVARGMRYTMGVEYMGLNTFLLESAVLLLSSLLVIFLVAYRSKWVE